MKTFNFLFLIKPEGHTVNVRQNLFLKMIHEHLIDHNVEVLSKKKIDGSTMKKIEILNWIYPRLSVISEFGEISLTNHERKLLLDTFGTQKILTASEALDAFSFSSNQLCIEGDKTDVIKLGPGAYAAYFKKYKASVLNHFFSEFCVRFYATNSKISAFECVGRGQELEKLRNGLVGNINPSKALLGSLRFSASIRSNELGLGNVNISRNFFHISPSYLEALVQLSFLFPENGTLSNRLLSAGVLLTEKEQIHCNDRINLSKALAKSESLPIDKAFNSIRL